MRSAARTAGAWIALAGLLGAAALLGRFVPTTTLDWQPALAAAEPWRAWSAVAVHYSTMHLLANLAGVLLVGALGWVGEVPLRGAIAWAVSWPLTQFGLLAGPELAHYGGLSGVLHAGVAIAAVHLLVAGPRARRLIAAAILAGLTVKVFGEAPWGPVITHPPGWDIAVAPLAHASGALAGLLCGLAALLRPARRPPPEHAP